MIGAEYYGSENVRLVCVKVDPDLRCFWQMRPGSMLLDRMVGGFRSSKVRT